jgi:hypothetical protein
MQTLAAEKHVAEIDWAGLIPEHDWQLYRRVLDLTLKEGIPFALGGGFAFSYYSRRWRDTKDLDLYVLPHDRERMVEILNQTGFRDLHDQKPYDRKWIYRGWLDDVITDIIWAMANQRAEVDEVWLGRSPEIELHGLKLRLLPAEELIWAKLYVMQRDRCDWPDLLNILNVRGPGLDWRHLLTRVGDDVRLLGGVMSVFCWMCPGRAVALPSWIWDRLGLHPPAAGSDCECNRRRVALLDSRDWFGPIRSGEKGDTIAPTQS